MMSRFFAWRLLPVIALLVAVLAGCGGDGDDDATGSGLIAPPTRTPAPVTAGDAADSAGSAGEDAPQYRLQAHTVGRGSVGALAWATDPAQLLASGTLGTWAYAVPPDAPPDLLDTPWQGTGTFNTDGSRIVAQDADGMRALFDVATGERLLTVAREDESAWYVTFSADSEQLAALIVPPLPDTVTYNYSRYSGTVPEGTMLHIWDIASGAEAEYTPPDDRILDMVFAADGRLIVAGSAENIVRYEFIGANEPPREIPAQSDDLTVRLWDIAAEEVIATIADPNYAVESATLSPDAAYLAAPITAATSQYGTTEWRLQIWDTRSGDVLHTFDTDTVGGYDVRAFSPDGSLFAAVVNVRDDDSRTFFTFDQVWLWNVASGDTHAILVSEALGSERSSLIRSLAFNADGSQLAALSGDGMLLAWDTAPADTHEPVFLRSDFMGPVISAAVSHDAQTVYTASDSTTIHTWDAHDGSSRESITGAPGIVTDLLTGPDGLLVASLGYDQARMQAWDTDSGTRLGMIDNDFRPLRYAGINTDGTIIATSTGGGTVSLRSVQDGHVDGVLLVPNQVSALAYNPDGTQLATGSMDGTILVWDAATNEQIARLNGQGGISHLAYSADGQTLISASLETLYVQDNRFGTLKVQGEPDYTVTRWDVAANQVLSTIMLPEPAAPEDMQDTTSLAPGILSGTPRLALAALSADGSRLAWMAWTDGSQALSVWDVTTGQMLATQPMPTADVTALAIGPAGDVIVTGHANGTLTLWDVAAP